MTRIGGVKGTDGGQALVGGRDPVRSRNRLGCHEAAFATRSLWHCRQQEEGLLAKREESGVSPYDDVLFIST